MRKGETAKGGSVPRDFEGAAIEFEDVGGRTSAFVRGRQALGTRKGPGIAEINTSKARAGDKKGKANNSPVKRKPEEIGFDSANNKRRPKIVSNRTLAAKKTKPT